MELFVFPSEHGLLQDKDALFYSFCNPSTWQAVRDVEDAQWMFTEWYWRQQ